MSDRTEIALRKFFEGYNCAQAVLYAFCDELSLDADAAFRIAIGFGGGMGGRGLVCGALTGGTMVIGLKFSMSGSDEKNPKELVYKKTRALLKEFESRYGTVFCNELLEKDCPLIFCDNEKRWDRICVNSVRDVVEIVEKLLMNNTSKPDNITNVIQKTDDG